MKYKIDSSVDSVLDKDGINKVDSKVKGFTHFKRNQYIQKLNKFKKSSWADRIIYNETFSATLICQKYNETNRVHFHKKDDEWWVILQGKIKWWIQDVGEIIASKGDIVFVPRGKLHKIKTISKTNSIRLAICRPDIPHFHVDNEKMIKNF